MKGPILDTALLNQIGTFSSTQLTRLLGLVTVELTIAGRETYVPGSMEVEDPLKLRALNECQHFLLGILRRLLFGERVDVSALTESLASLSGDERVGGTIQSALRRAMRQLEPSAAPG